MKETRKRFERTKLHFLNCEFLVSFEIEVEIFKCISLVEARPDFFLSL